MRDDPYRGCRCRPCRRRPGCRVARCRPRDLRGRGRVRRVPDPDRDAAARRARRQADRRRAVLRPAAAHGARRHARQRGHDAVRLGRDPARPVRRAHLGQARHRGARARRRPRRPGARDAPGDDLHRHRRRPGPAARLRVRGDRRRRAPAGSPRRLVADLGGRMVWVDEDKRTLYHAGLAHGANHLVTLVAQAMDLLRGLRRRRPRRARCGRCSPRRSTTRCPTATPPSPARSCGGTSRRCGPTSPTSRRPRPETLESYVVMARATAEPRRARRAAAADPRGQARRHAQRRPGGAAGPARRRARCAGAPAAVTPRPVPRPRRRAHPRRAGLGAGRHPAPAADGWRWSRRWAPCTPATPPWSRRPAARRAARRGRGVDLREPAAVRPRRGPRPLPPHLRGRPRGLRASRAPTWCSRRRSTRSTPAATRRSPSSPARSATVLEGATRPGHFRGVLTVVAKLLRAGPARRRGVRPEGLPAAGAGPADGRRPLHGRRGRRRRDRARARRPGAVLAATRYLAADERAAAAGAVRGRCGRGPRPAPRGCRPRSLAAARAVLDAAPASSSTTSRSRAPDLGRPAGVRRGAAARRRPGRHARG